MHEDWFIFLSFHNIYKLNILIFKGLIVSFLFIKTDSCSNTLSASCCCWLFDRNLNSSSQVLLAKILPSLANAILTTFLFLFESTPVTSLHLVSLFEALLILFALPIYRLSVFTARAFKLHAYVIVILVFSFAAPFVLFYPVQQIFSTY